MVGGAVGTGWSERDGYKDGNGISQVFESEWLGCGFGRGVKKKLIICVCRDL